MVAYIFCSTIYMFFIPKRHKTIVKVMETNDISPQITNSIEVVSFFWPSFSPRSLFSLQFSWGLMWTRLQCYSTSIVLLVFNGRVTRLETWFLGPHSAFISHETPSHVETIAATILDWHGNQQAISSSHHPRNVCLWDSKSAKILLVDSLESWALESEIQLRNPEFHQQIGIQNPGSTVKDWNSVPEILNQRRGIQNPRDQDCLGIPFTGRHIFYFHWLIFNSSTNVKKLLNKEYKPRCNNALLLCQKIVHKLDEYIYICPGDVLWR